MDHATSSSPAVQAQLDRLTALSPGADILGLERIRALLARLGNPHLALPPVFHVAGTNGKGSTCAFLRAALEADGRRVHVFTSPHLVRFNERIRVAGTLIEDEALAHYLSRVLDIGDGIGASFFEVSTAAAFLAFAEIAADACVIEVGLGGRLDATNVVVDPAACGIAQLGLDHQSFLGDTLAAIAREKAGIAKPGRPLVTLDYGEEINAEVRDVADRAGARVLRSGRDWQFGAEGAEGVHRRGGDETIRTPLPVLAGDHQLGNLALAIAMLRAQDRMAVSREAMTAAATTARWPARMQRIADGPLVRRLPAGSKVWLDGGHNPAAAGAVARTLADALGGGRAHLVLGMLANKDAGGFLAPFVPLAASLVAVPIPGHEHHAPEALAQIARAQGIASPDAAATNAAATTAAATTAADVSAAFDVIAAAGRPVRVLVLGSLYLAGAVLAANDEIPE